MRAVLTEFLREVRTAGIPVSLANLAIHDAVNVTLRAGTTIAASIAANGPESDEVKGTVTALTSTSISILTNRGREVTFGITPSTRVEMHHRPAALTDLAVGQEVEIEFSPGAREALKIDIEEDEAQIDEVSGKVTAVNVGAGTLTIQPRNGASLTLTVNASTTIRIEDRGGVLADIMVGDDAKVHFDTATNIATHIEVDRKDEGDDEDEVNGVVSAVGAATVSVRERNGNIDTFGVTSTTRIRIGDRSGTLADIHVGDRVEVEFVPATKVATKIVVKADDDEDDDGGDD